MKTTQFATLAILTALAFNPAYALDKTAATVNGVVISQERVEMSVKGAITQGQTDTPDLRKAILDELISREVVAQEAVKNGLNKSPEVIQQFDDVAKQLEFAKQTILVNAYAQDYLKKNPITEEQVKQAYQTIKTQFTGEKEYQISHILVETPEDAQAIIAQLGKKAKFETLATKSIDPRSAQNGGLLGWAILKKIPEPFANALLNLKKGQYTKQPVQTKDGWHVIKLNDMRDLKVPEYEELKPQLEQRLQQQAIQKAIGALRSTAKIE